MILEAVVEIPAGTSYKYEVCKNSGELVLDRVSPIQIPFNYGFIPGTMCGDGDPLDIFIVSTEVIPPKTRAKVRIIGGFKCKDNGDEDDKVVGVLVGEDEDLRHEDLMGIEHMIVYYLQNYKKGFEIVSNMNAYEAENAYLESKNEQDS